MENDPRPLMPGDRVRVFHGSAWRRGTPTKEAWKPGTIVCRYGSRTIMKEHDINWKYPDLVDILFDCEPERISKGHFTNGVETID